MVQPLTSKKEPERWIKDLVMPPNEGSCENYTEAKAIVSKVINTVLNHREYLRKDGEEPRSINVGMTEDQFNEFVGRINKGIDDFRSNVEFNK